MKTITPKSITPEIRKFCRQVVPTGELVYLEVQPVPSSKALDCFQNVRNRVSTDRGSIQYGWRIWEWPRVMVEAEFHAVWLSPDNNYVDITPARERRVLFLPDPVRIYMGRQVDNIRGPLADSPLVHEFIQVNERIFEEMNKGELADMHGAVSLPAHVIAPLLRRKQELMLMLRGGKVGHNDPCLCGSGLKYKKCCG